MCAHGTCLSQAMEREHAAEAKLAMEKNLLLEVHFICELDALAFSTGIARPCLEREGSVQGETRTPRRRWGVPVRVL